MLAECKKLYILCVSLDNVLNESIMYFVKGV